MDIFYRTENIEVFKKWIYFQIKNDSRLTLEICDSQTYKMTYQNKVATFVVWPIGIIEETINDGDKLLFYLHYQFYNFHFAMDLFYRMINKLTEDTKDEMKHILLCCTGGMTTGFFAEKMNKYCELNQLPYEISASAIYNLDNVFKDYELILIAPQLRYKVMELSQKYKPTIVKSIEPVAFATYDCQALLTQIEEFYKEIK